MDYMSLRAGKDHPQVSGLMEEGNGKWISLALFEKWEMSTARLHIWIREQGSPDTAWMDLVVRLAGVLCWFEKSCKFLQDRVRFPVWACLHRLHFVPNKSDSISVMFHSFLIKSLWEGAETQCVSSAWTSSILSVFNHAIIGHLSSGWGKIMRLGATVRPHLSNFL